MEGSDVFLSLVSGGLTGSPAYWGICEIADLRLLAGSPGIHPIPYEPRRAVELLFLANGRWTQGRTVEAIELYDKAIAAGDLEREHDRALKEKGLPSEFDFFWAAPYLKWVSVDARLWRGLLRATLGRREEGLQDLRDAAGISPERFETLVMNSALPLANFPEAAAALAVYYRERAGLGPDADPRELARWLFKEYDEGAADLADTLLASSELQIARYLTVEAVQSEGAAPPVQKGDIVLSYDGAKVSDWGELRRAQGKARDDEKIEVEVEIVRGGHSQVVRIDPQRVTIQAGVSFGIEEKK